MTMVIMVVMMKYDLRFIIIIIVYIYIYMNCLYIYIYKLPMCSVAKASDTQAVGHGFDPRPDH